MYLCLSLQPSGAALLRPVALTPTLSMKTTMCWSSNLQAYSFHCPLFHNKHVGVIGFWKSAALCGGTQGFLGNLLLEKKTYPRINWLLAGTELHRRKYIQIVLFNVCHAFCSPRGVITTVKADVLS